MNSLTAIQTDTGASERAARPQTPPFDPSSRADFQLQNSYFPAVPKPIIGAINGACAGLGLVMALYTDLRFASDAAVFTTALGPTSKARRTATVFSDVANAVRKVTEPLYSRE